MKRRQGDRRTLMRSWPVASSCFVALMECLGCDSSDPSLATPDGGVSNEDGADVGTKVPDELPDAENGPDGPDVPDPNATPDAATPPETCGTLIRGFSPPYPTTLNVFPAAIQVLTELGVQIAFSAPSGTLVPNGTSAQFTCAGAGPVEIAVDAALGNCTEHSSVVVQCVAELDTPPELVSVETALSDGGDIIYLFSRYSNRIFRWSASAGDYLPSIWLDPARGTPAQIAYATHDDRLYVGYEQGLVSFVDAALQEHDFATMSARLRGLVVAGDFVVVADESGIWPESFVQHVFNRAGVQTASRARNQEGRDHAYDPISGRVFALAGSYGPLFYDQLDAAGAIVASNESYDAVEYDFLPPLRVSPDGEQLFLGTRDTLDAQSLERVFAMPGNVVDAQWLADGAIASIRAFEGNTLLERRDAQGNLVEALTLPHRPVALVPLSDRFIIVGMSGGYSPDGASYLGPELPAFAAWVPDDDSDGDGAPNVTDAFPLDAAAAVDGDRDGAPDAWNSGYDAGTGTSQLLVDAFPNDSACQAARAGACDVAARVPAYVADQIVVDTAGVFYLLSTAHQRVFRWSSLSGLDLNPIVLGVEAPLDPAGPRNMAYSAAHSRLYLGYDGGAVSYVDLSAELARERVLARVPLPVGGLASVGDFVVAEDESGSFGQTHFVFDRDGALRGSRSDSDFSRVFTHDPTTGRVYYFRDHITPNHTQFESIDAATGAFTEVGEINNDLAVAAPMRVTADGSRLLLGTGDVYDSATLSWRDNIFRASSVPTFHDAQWLDTGGVVTIRAAAGDTLLERKNPAFAGVERQLFEGPPQALFDVGDSFIVVTRGERPIFSRYVPNDDADGDGMGNELDDFPRDAAAAIDSDGDGHPDAWNSGQSEATTSTGLALDAFPEDSACTRLEQGALGVCDVGAALPAYVPDQIRVDEAGMLYLLSTAQRRVFRWDSRTEQHENPLIVGSEDPLDLSSPRYMSPVSSQGRVFLGYSSGAISYLELASDLTRQHDFAMFPQPVHALAEMGAFLHVATRGISSGGFEHIVFDALGAPSRVTSGAFLDAPLAQEFDPVKGRMYFLEDDSYGALFFEAFDLVSGAATSFGGSASLQEIPRQPPIRLSSDGNRVLLGSGDIYDTEQFVRQAGLSTAIVDAQWLRGGGFVTVRPFPSGTLLERWGAALELTEILLITGAPLALVRSGPDLVVVTDEGRPSFFVYVTGDD